MSTTDKHECPFDWCQISPGQPSQPEEHWGVVYYPATARHGFVSSDEEPLRIGVGISYEKGDYPEVVIHLDGGRHEYDADAFLRAGEAKALRDALCRVVDEDMVEVLRYMVQDYTFTGDEIGGQ